MTWSTGNTTASLASSSHDLFFNSPFSRPSLGTNGLTILGKSTWGPTDWLSSNPRFDGQVQFAVVLWWNVTLPNPPFGFTRLGHGVLGRYDLFPPSLAHDFASDAGPEHDRLSTLSDPEMMPSSVSMGSHTAITMLVTSSLALAVTSFPFR
jgi:hypothetical protein